MADVPKTHPALRLFLTPILQGNEVENVEAAEGALLELVKNKHSIRMLLGRILSPHEGRIGVAAIIAALRLILDDMDHTLEALQHLAASRNRPSRSSRVQRKTQRQRPPRSRR